MAAVGLFGIVVVVGFFGLILVVALWLMAVYNGLVRLRNEVENAWSQIDVQLKRRHDLIPNLLETVKGYMKHERETLENITLARSQAMGAKGVHEQAQAENMLTQALGGLRVAVEAYPDLKASQNFMQLQEELTSTENKISFARQYYNDGVMRYNTSLQSFPNNMVAGPFGFKEREFFEIEEPAQREVPKVQF
ncbi:MAG: LemA family protein [Candidatus Hydrogenedentes bacterium]|nr:LemA family protein [Candidatus Hydrogenedentota bacterium]